MNSWLRALMGLEEGEVPPGGESHWELAGLPEDPGLLLLSAVIVAACLAVIVLLYVTEKHLSTMQRLVLALLRGGALLVVLLVLLNPRLLTEIRFTRPGKTLVLFDVSASMAQKDDYEGRESAMVQRATDLDLRVKWSRTELAVAAMRNQKFVERLAENNRVGLYSFAEELKPLAKIDGPGDVAATGQETRLGQAVGDALNEVGHEPLAGIVVISDGRSTGGRSLADARRELATRYGAQVHGVGVGRSQLPRNYAVKELRGPKGVEVGYPLEIEARIALSGIPGTVEVVLSRALKSGRDKVEVERRRVELRDGSLEARLRFIDTIPREGVYRYTLRIPTRREEMNRSDNQRHIFVEASEEEYRVLLLAGDPVPEFRWLRNFTVRDDGIQVSTWQTTADRLHIQDGDVRIDRPPESAAELSEYDVVILIDPEPETLTPTFQEGLKDFVAEQGGGLVYVASETHTPLIAGDPEFRDLAALLPVRLKSRVRDAPGTEYSEPWRPRLTARGAAHNICRILDDQRENRKFWSRTPPFFYAHPDGGLRPAGVALLTSPHGRIVAAVQRVGLGETIYLGTDGFWRLRAVDVGYHERFWAGIVRYLSMGKKLGGHLEVSVETDRDVYRRDEPVRIRARLVSAKGQPGDTSRADVSIERLPHPDESPTSPSPTGPSKTGAGETQGERWVVGLSARQGQSGVFSGLFRPPLPGHYRLRLEPGGEASFDVVPQALEWEDTSPDFESLQRLAEDTGGDFVRLDGLEELGDSVPPVTRTEVLGRRATAVWDSAALMLLFCGLLTVEWILRKLWRLN